MSEISDLLKAIAERCEKNALSDDNYMGEDGLVYCGKCHTPRQTLLNGDVKVYCMCECQTAEYKKQRQEMAEEQLKYRIELLRKEAFPPNTVYRNWTFERDNGKNPEIMKLCRSYVERFLEFRELHKGLLLFGEKGVGKSYAAACMANALINRGRRVYMTNFSRIANELQNSFSGRNAYLDELCSADLLIIDDFQAERNTEYMREVVFTVIDARYNTGLPLIITSNITAADIKEYDKDRNTARIISRLLEMCHPVEVKGQDIRKEKLKTDYAVIHKMLSEPAQESSFDLAELERTHLAKYKE